MWGGWWASEEAPAAITSSYYDATARIRIGDEPTATDSDPSINIPLDLVAFATFQDELADWDTPVDLDNDANTPSRRGVGSGHRH